MKFSLEATVIEVSRAVRQRDERPRIPVREEILLVLTV
jgi:hypothetical protein